MLVEFRVKNYRSIGEEQTFSMVRGVGDENPQNTIEPQSRMKEGLLRSAVLYGANASGKSNLIRALFTMRQLVVDSTDNKPGDKINNITPFVFRKELRSEPTEFDLTFIHENIRYQYGIAVDSVSVREEWLYSYPMGQQRTLFHRTLENSKKGISEFYFGPDFIGPKISLGRSTPNNVLFLSKAAKENHPLLGDLFLWFRQAISINIMYKNLTRMQRYTASLIHDSPVALKKVQQNIQEADFRIKYLHTEIGSLIEDPRFLEFPEEIRKHVFEDLKLTKTIEVKSVHTSDPDIVLDFDEESEGTQRYFGLQGPLFDVFEKGSTLVVDELDSSLHPLLVRKIVEMFHDPEVNKNNAQLIFSTHNTNLLDPELFRRDQIWFVEKDKKEQSQYYSLLEYKTENGSIPRKREAWERGYLAGRYGAIPFLGRFGF